MVTTRRALAQQCESHEPAARDWRDFSHAHTAKKKKAISPSLTQSRKVRAWAPIAGPTCPSQRPIQPALAAVLARRIDTAELSRSLAQRRHCISATAKARGGRPKQEANLALRLRISSGSR
eukprot:scaffold209_cov396-Prasinococcus_capsulatus_cf.AAC.4